MRAVLSQDSAGIAIIDRSGRLIEVNERLCSILRRSREELLQLTCEKLTHPDDWGCNTVPIGELLDETRPGFVAEKRYAGGDGTWVWVHTSFSPIRTRGGMVEHLMAVVIDISEAQQRDQALRESEERFARFMRYLPGLAWIKDSEGRYVFINDLAEQAFGKPRAQVYGKTDREIFPQETAREFMDNDKRVRESGATVQTIETLQHDDGWHYSLVNKFPIPSARDGTMMIGGIAIDVTQHRRAEEALRESEERLRVFAARLEHLVEERTHELIQSQADLRALATELTLTEERARQRLATDLHDYLAQIIVLSKLRLAQTRQIPGLPRRSNDLVTEAEEALSDALTYIRTLIADLSPPVLHQFGLAVALKWLGEQMDRHQLAVTVELLHENPPVPEHHAMLLFQSVRELLMNSAKHAESKEATVRLEIIDQVLRIHVRDNGKGFDPAIARLSTALSSKFGLFSIRERMKALGGDFDLTSAPGKGTSATLMLPVHEIGRDDFRGRTAPHLNLATTPTMYGLNVSPSASAQMSAKAKPIRVLLVDDHAMVRQGLRSVLDSYDDVEIVGEAHDGMEATARAATLKPSVIVMDINMPRMNGIEATARIKKLYPEIIVIGLSVNSERENQDAMKKAGAAELLTKEAAVNELHRAIRQGLQRRETPSFNA